MTQQPMKTYCARHPKVETNLRCGKCNQLICPKCAVQTPVGARCPDCAGQYRLPVFQVSIVHYLKAVGVGLALAIAMGIIWGILDSSLRGFSWFLILPASYAIGELTSRAVNRKRNIGLQVITGVAVGLCFATAIMVDDSVLDLYSILAAVAGIFIAVSQFR